MRRDKQIRCTDSSAWYWASLKEEIRRFTGIYKDMKPLKSAFLQNYRANHEKQENKHHQYFLIANPVHKSAASTVNCSSCMLRCFWLTLLSPVSTNLKYSKDDYFTFCMQTIDVLFIKSLEKRFIVQMYCKLKHRHPRLPASCPVCCSDFHD